MHRTDVHHSMTSSARKAKRPGSLEVDHQQREIGEGPFRLLPDKRPGRSTETSLGWIAFERPNRVDGTGALRFGSEREPRRR
jgi:hypothetical protein